jgi:hypothetical protein
MTLSEKVSVRRHLQIFEDKLPNTRGHDPLEKVDWWAKGFITRLARLIHDIGRSK